MSSSPRATASADRASRSADEMNLLLTSLASDASVAGSVRTDRHVTHAVHARHGTSAWRQEAYLDEVVHRGQRIGPVPVARAAEQLQLWSGRDGAETDPAVEPLLV